MSILLLLVIYLIFVSLGLPDSFLGSCWPSISQSFNVNESFQGIFTIVVCLCTVISSFLTAPLQRKFSTFAICSVSICLTVSGILLSFFSINPLMMILAMIPLGLGAGCIDSVLNNYIAIHYKAHHLQFLHGCWSLGAILAPIVSSQFLINPDGWRNALLVLAITQGCILIITLISYPLWKKNDNEISRNNENENKSEIKLKFFDIFKIRGAFAIIISFFFLTAAEYLLFSWYSSMMVFSKNVLETDASFYFSFIYVGYTVSRVLAAFLTKILSDKNIIRIFGIIFIGAVFFLLFNNEMTISPIVTFLLGFGLGPIYPAIVHDTPIKFTEGLSLNVMSIQIGCAYISSITLSPLFGVIGENFGFDLLPYALILVSIIMLICAEIANIQTKDKSKLLIHIKNN